MPKNTSASASWRKVKCLSNFNFMLFSASIFPFFYFREKNIGVNYDTFIAYVFPKFDKKSHKFGCETD